MDAPVSLLLVEDDLKAATLLVERFRSQGLEVAHAANGELGLAAAQATPFDVLVVDRMMPKLNGVDMVTQLRAGGIQTPVLFLSGLGEVEDRVEGFTAGGDNYLVKPYAFAELQARVMALAKRQAWPPETILQLGDLTLDVVARRATRGGAELALNPREFTLLEYLLRQKNQTVTRTMLLENVWNYRADMQTNVVDVHISRLRAKLDKGFDTPLLHTLRGQGFVLKEATT
ncbi:MAG: response regulator transcription factor [Rhodobiaceae bacterium]|nr:response regulator transcription factor [Rhodobiaceae bacterium]